MKKPDAIILTGILLYSFLFYKQVAGINFILFNLFLITGLILKNENLYKDRKWVVVAIFSILSSFSITLYGTNLTVITNIISLAILSSYSVDSKSSVLAAMSFSAYSVLSSIAYLPFDAFERRKNKLTDNSNSSTQKAMVIFLPLLMVIIFFFLYRASNPIFSQVTSQLNFDFISYQLFFFTLSGALIMYGFFFPKQIGSLIRYENSTPNYLSPGDGEFIFMGRALGIQHEYQSGLVLLIALNLLLFVVNILDIKYLFGGILPLGLTYSAFVHQGIGALICSIVFAIAIILFYFRGNLNFYKENKLLKLLSYAWIFQNLFMILSTAFRNQLYIVEYSLTYKRIGVYVFLLLASIGLVTTLLKIAKTRSNYYLLRVNSILFFLVMVICSFIQWDSIICNFNIENKKDSRTLDYDYLLSLGNVAIPYLIKHNQSENTGNISGTNKTKATGYSNHYNKVDKALVGFVGPFQTYDWRSLNLSDLKVFNEIKDLKENGKITQLDLSNTYYLDLSSLEFFSELKGLTYNYGNKSSIRHLKNLNQLEYLSIKGNAIKQTFDLPVLLNLKELDISNNQIKIIGDISKLKSLQRLNISRNDLIFLNGIEKLNELEEIDISSNGDLKDLSPLFKLKKLKQITMDMRFKFMINDFKSSFPDIKINLI